MPSTAHLLAFAVVSLVFVAIPGPSVLFTVSRALAYGRRPALLTVLGNAAGVYLHVIGVALGVAAIVAQSIAIFTILKLAGAAYLIYLGIQAVRRRHAATQQLNQPVAPARNQRVFADGFIVGVTNPKSIVFFAAVLPQFIDASAGHVPTQLLILGAVSIAAALLSDSAWALAASAARDWFGRSPRRLAAIGGAGGLAMVGLGVHLALTGRND
jgi:threonine/homoserine/homoserine lactone efflux protein